MTSHLRPASHDLFFSKHDSADPRLGEVAKQCTLEEADQFDVLIIGVPEDRGISNQGGRPGAGQAPTEIRRQLYKLTTGLLGKLRIGDVGDVASGATLEETHERTRTLLVQLFPTRVLVLGGGHDLAFPHIAALIESLSPVQKAAVINVDAHLDVRPVLDVIGSGTPFRRLLEMDDKRFSPADFVDFGVQPQTCSVAHVDYIKERGGTVLPLDLIADPIDEFSSILQGWRNRVVAVSFDMDCVRMSDALGVSSPSPVGFPAEVAIEICRLAGRRPCVRTLGMYEVSPPLDNGTSVRLAARCCYGFLEGVSKA